MCQYLTIQESQVLPLKACHKFLSSMSQQFSHLSKLRGCCLAMPFTKRRRESKFSYYSEPVVSECKEKLLPHQYEACMSLRKWFCRDNKQEIALVSMPTGSGKTGIICCLPFFLAQQKDDEPKREVDFSKPILVIAPNLEIASQLERAITITPDGTDENFLLKRKIAPSDLDMQKDVIPSGRKVERTSDVAKEKFLSHYDFIIANAQKFLEGSWEGSLSSDLFQAVIVDEAHHFPAQTWLRIIEKFKRNAMVVFLTATPYRSDRKKVVSQENVAYFLSLEEAREKRVIRKTSWDEFDCESDDDQGAIESLLNEINRIQREKNKSHSLPDGIPHMAIAIAKDIPSATTAVAFWNKHFGDTAIGYHSGVRKVRRVPLMTRIKKNEVRLVVVVDMLQEGFDHPPISIAAILTKITSPVKFVQFIGRAQRIVRGGGQSESPDIVANVVTHTRFQQRRNYEMFQKERLIAVNNPNDG